MGDSRLGIVQRPSSQKHSVSHDRKLFSGDFWWLNHFDNFRDLTGRAPGPPSTTKLDRQISEVVKYQSRPTTNSGRALSGKRVRSAQHRLLGTTRKEHDALYPLQGVNPRPKSNNSNGANTIKPTGFRYTTVPKRTQSMYSTIGIPFDPVNCNPSEAVENYNSLMPRKGTHELQRSKATNGAFRGNSPRKSILKSSQHHSSSSDMVYFDKSSHSSIGTNQRYMSGRYNVRYGTHCDDKATAYDIYDELLKCHALKQRHTNSSQNFDQNHNTHPSTKTHEIQAQYINTSTNSIDSLCNGISDDKAQVEDKLDPKLNPSNKEQSTMEELTAEFNCLAPTDNDTSDVVDENNTNRPVIRVPVKELEEFPVFEDSPSTVEADQPEQIRCQNENDRNEIELKIKYYQDKASKTAQMKEKIIRANLTLSEYTSVNIDSSDAMFENQNDTEKKLSTDEDSKVNSAEDKNSKEEPTMDDPKAKKTKRSVRFSGSNDIHEYNPLDPPC